MRPVGSANGRTPPGGYPRVSAADGAFLAGFLEGEACFSIVKQAHGQGYGCVVRTACREDDGPMLVALAERTLLGSITHKAPRGTSRPQVSWNIGAKADCMRLVELLDNFPLRGRKSHDYGLWRSAVEWWIDGDPTARRSGRDWTPMAYLKGRLHEVKRFHGAAPPRIPDPPGLVRDWADFLAGFLTAEASLGFALVSEGRVRPRMAVNLRADDRELLDELAQRTLVGRTGGPYRNVGSSPSVKWTVVKLDDLVRLSAILDRHQLRGRKFAEFVIWKEAVRAYGERGSRFEAELARLRGELARLRNRTWAT